ncbi:MULTISPECIES: helix-turn-helix domain-containing protein [Mycobacterium]|nr:MULTISPECIES: helix-turn-helix transcriptional regulator [Mycobacterium]
MTTMPVQPRLAGKPLLRLQLQLQLLGRRRKPRPAFLKFAIIDGHSMNSCVAEMRICIDFVQYSIVQLMVQRGAIRMTPEQIAKLINLLKIKRTELRLSANEVAKRAKVDPGTVWRIEQGLIANPRVENLVAIGRVLAISPMELFTTAGWFTADDLPDFGTYLSTKFEGIPEAAVEDIEQYVDKTLDAHTRRSSPHQSLRHYNHCPQCPPRPEGVLT